MNREKKLLWGFIDRSGNYVIEPRFDDAMNFHEDLAVVGWIISVDSLTAPALLQ